MDPSAPELYQPQLRLWSHAWRITLMLVISAFTWLPNFRGQSAAIRMTDVGIGLLCFALVLYRRRFPVTSGVVIGLLSCLSGVAAGGPAALVTVSVATRRRGVEMAAVAGATFVGGQVYSMTQTDNHESFWVIFIVNVVITAALIAWGMYVGSRRELLWTLRHRADQAEAEQDLRMRQARSTERARIAREMHDVLAHRISQIAMHAGALAFREDLSATEMRGNAELIQAKAHEALNDLRGVLGVLRDDDGAPMDAPQPTYTDVADLVSEARRSGLAVDYDDRLTDGAEMPGVVGRTVYRIVQEGITNAHKHAPGTRLTIALSGSRDSGVDVVLHNPLGFGSRTPGAGLGLVGLSERTDLRGGRLEHHASDGAFVLHGWIPWAA